jgi:hypothetical protein
VEIALAVDQHLGSGLAVGRAAGLVDCHEHEGIPACAAFFEEADEACRIHDLAHPEYPYSEFI